MLTVYSMHQYQCLCLHDVYQIHVIVIICYTIYVWYAFCVYECMTAEKCHRNAHSSVVGE